MAVHKTVDNEVQPVPGEEGECSMGGRAAAIVTLTLFQQIKIDREWGRWRSVIITSDFICAR